MRKEAKTFKDMLLGIRLAKMSNEELLAYGFTQEEIEAGDHLMSVSGAASNSTQLITDMTTAINTTLSTTAVANALNANGPIQDLTGQMKTILLNFQEAAEKLNYLLAGTQIPAPSLTAPTGGPITSAADSAIYNLLVGIYQILK
jgi:hypothetical protein